jgi:hypothetical protein
MRYKMRTMWTIMLAGILAIVAGAPTGFAQTCPGVKATGGGSKCKTEMSKCSPVDLGFGDTGQCRTRGTAAEYECDCLGQSSPPTYALTATPLVSAWVAPGASVTTTISIVPSKGYTGNVTLSCVVKGGGAPAPNCEFQSGTNPVNGGSGKSMLTVIAATQTPNATYSVSVTGADRSGLAPSNGPQTLNLTVAAQPPGPATPVIETIFKPDPAEVGSKPTLMPPAAKYRGCLGAMARKLRECCETPNFCNT